MIRELDHTSRDTARMIHTVFQTSYAVEAELLRAVDFPPLKSGLDDFLNSKTTFYGCYLEANLVAVIEIVDEPPLTHIQGLVVAPPYFRQGFGQKMLEFAFDRFDSETFTVETGLGNAPALSLYKKFGFLETKQRDTDHNIRKVRLERKAQS